ncbi:glycosyltransferase family 4 protein [Microbulbifer hainanensis]|uniref:glycosyltransferase family 4 protein n=1 Tax=Microbulbifer hainanensis TaxID=2735675 RepID=UPI001868E5BF|nr:glycosyltransferase family 4 protein [Microbulbifer hainanensis]
MQFNVSNDTLRIAKSFFPELQAIKDGKNWNVKFNNKITHIPLFDSELVASQIGESFNSEAGTLELFFLWIDAGREQEIIPTRLFDEKFYLARNPDVQKSNMWAFDHFLLFGAEENRLPNSKTPDCAPEQVIEMRYQDATLSESDLGFLKSIIGFFKRQDVKLAIQQGDSREILTKLPEDENVLLLFNANVYRKSIASQHPELHIPEGKEFLHWIRNGRHLEAAFTPFFSIRHYRNTYSDLQKLSNEGLHQHFLNHGLYENRNGSSVFNAGQYANINRLKNRSSAVLFALKKLQDEGTPIPTRALTINHKSKLEHLAELGQQAELMAERLQSPEIRAQVKKAEAYEPRIDFRPQGRQVLCPQLNHPADDLHSADQLIYNNLAKTRYKALMLIPHCRMSGAARVSGALAHVLAKHFGDENICIVTTDGTAFEHPEWFPENVDILDLHKYTAHLDRDFKIQALVLLLRGVNAQHIYNVNSRLGWETIHSYGKQLSTLCSINSYMFCSDRTESGQRTGYPQEFFTSTFFYHEHFFVDNLQLKKELVQDHLLTKKFADKIVVLNTPTSQQISVAAEPGWKLSKLWNRKKRVFWAGRFDRQKNFNLLVEIAKNMPDIEFWVWGKPVLDSAPKDISEIKNIKLLGEYGDFSELPLESCHVWLYTSLWDGTPTIILDVATAGIPVVASPTGGIPELLDGFPEFLVSETDLLNPNAYISRIRSLVDNSDGAFERAHELQSRVTQLHDAVAFGEAIIETINLGA